MEKRIPHYPLSHVKELALQGKCRLTLTAQQDAFRAGFDPSEVVMEILKLEKKGFYKSMTTYSDHTVWQDVYHHEAKGMRLYVKLTVLEDVLVVSFKEL